MVNLAKRISESLFDQGKCLILRQDSQHGFRCINGRDIDTVSHIINLLHRKLHRLQLFANLGVLLPQLRKLLFQFLDPSIAGHDDSVLVYAFLLETSVFIPEPGVLTALMDQRPVRRIGQLGLRFVIQGLGLNSLSIPDLIRDGLHGFRGFR